MGGNLEYEIVIKYNPTDFESSPKNSASEVRGSDTELESIRSAQAIEGFPVADFYESARFKWTPEGYKVRAALKRYSEATHADH